jgi:hypothetical protein
LVERNIMRKASFAVVAICATLLWVGTVPAGKGGDSQRITDNGDGTVTDHRTGLMWEKKTGTIGTIPVNPNLHDVNNRYTWCSGDNRDCNNSSSNPSDGDVFIAFLYGLNSGTWGGRTPCDTKGCDNAEPIAGCFANHCDWRLPSILELQEIFDEKEGRCAGGSGPCIDPSFGPTQFDAALQSKSYWSANTFFPDPNSNPGEAAWLVHFGRRDTFLRVFVDGKAIRYYVRAVRGGK